VLQKGGFFLSELVPSARQRRAAAMVAMALALAGLVVVPYAQVALPVVPAFVPTIDTLLFFTDLTTAVLLYAQFGASRSAAVLSLACGYLFTALVILAHLWTFPGTLSAGGLLGATMQSTVWLYILWHLGLPPAVIAYTVLKEQPRAPLADPRAAVVRSTTAVVLLVGVAVAVIMVDGGMLPPIMVDGLRANARWGQFAAPLILLLSAAALWQLWRRRSSLLDVWLLVVLWAWLIETLLLTLSGQRYTVVWYAARTFGVLSSSFVLLALVYESTMIYARLAAAEAAREREHESKRLSLEVTVGSIAHELRQPLTAIVANCYAGLDLLGQSPPDLGEARIALGEIEGEALRASEIISSIHGTVADTATPVGLVDVSQMVRESVALLRAELQFHEVVVRLETAAGLPRVRGNKGQLLQVMVNLVTNAVFAMRDITTRAHVLSIRTQLHDPDTVSIQVEDSGSGIRPELATRIFEPLFTTKERGNGLGLAICRSIVEAHEGRIGVLRGGAQGACLQVLLPIPGAA
jgi:signal transduction histidine kinase